MSFTVYALWFKNRDPSSRNDFHWSIFIRPTSNLVGTKYDAYNVGGPQWALSSAPLYTMDQSVSFGGHVLLGYINDVAALERVMASTPLPIPGENCQTWIWKVVRTAISLGLLPATALQQLSTLPVRPT